MKIFYLTVNSEELEIELIGGMLSCKYKNWMKSWDVAELYDKHRLTSDNFSLQVWATTKGILEPFHSTPTRMFFPVELLKGNNEAIDKQLFYIMFNGKDDFCVCSRTFKVKSSTGITVACEGNLFAEVVKLYPNFANNSRKYDLKRKLLYKLDCNDSLSGNEKQVDMLTKIVKVIASHYASEIAAEFPEYKDFLDAVDETSSMNQDTASECIANMRKHKSYIRKVVREYRRDKDK